MVKMFKKLLLSSFMINQSHFIGYFVSPCGDMRVLWGQKEDNSGPRQSFTEWWTYPIKGHLCEDLIICSKIFVSWMRKVSLRSVSLGVSGFLSELFWLKIREIISELFKPDPEVGWASGLMQSRCQLWLFIYLFFPQGILPYVQIHSQRAFLMVATCLPPETGVFFLIHTSGE